MNESPLREAGLGRGLIPGTSWQDGSGFGAEDGRSELELFSELMRLTIPGCLSIRCGIGRGVGGGTVKGARLVYIGVRLLLRHVHKDCILALAYVDPYSFSLSAWNCLRNFS